MITFNATLLKFDKQGEKTGWTYIQVPAEIAQQIKPGIKKSFRVKGNLDAFAFRQVSLLPMGEGNFILAINAAMRKGIGKTKGAVVKVQMAEDTVQYQVNRELLECLADEPEALQRFTAMPASHQHYYSKWIESAKTTATRSKRIAIAVSGLAAKLDFGEMLRSERDKKLF